ncbi:hypothetical protein I3760_09G181600 [Carya illinoinensis]|nr:hypothetical protein I3760_09G181600 [Carya illinoinensis]
METLQMGENISKVSNGIVSYNIRQSLGVCAKICSFKFSAIIPLWMFPITVTGGSTSVLKLYEKELAMEADLPNGVIIILLMLIVMVTISECYRLLVLIHIYARALAKGKHVQTIIEAKNHAIDMPDANRVDAIVKRILLEDM